MKPLMDSPLYRIGSPVILGVVLGVLALAAFRPSTATAHDHRVIVGLATTWANFFPWGWHGPGSNLDLNIGASTPGASVYWQSKHMSGNRGLNVLTIDHPGVCTGQDVYVSDGSTLDPLGNYWFVHISPIGSGVYTWGNPNGSYTIRYFGSVLGDYDETPDCENAGLHDGAHLHQGGDNAGWTAVYTNWGLTSSNPISPTGDATNKWMHKYEW